MGLVSPDTCLYMENDVGMEINTMRNPSLYILYLIRLGVAWYALSVLCTERPYGFAVETLVWFNGFLMPIAAIVFLYARTGVADLATCVAHSAAVIALAQAPSTSADLALFGQLLALCTDTERAVYYLMEAHSFN